MDQYRVSPATSPWRLGIVQLFQSVMLHRNNSNYMDDRNEVKRFLVQRSKKVETLFFSTDWVN
jgi:hypothetical protein